jgi:hypothetical protein
VKYRIYIYIYIERERERERDWMPLIFTLSMVGKKEEFEWAYSAKPRRDI